MGVIKSNKKLLADKFHDKFKTMKNRIMRHQREHGSFADYIILMKNNLQDHKSKNASPTAGKYMVFGEGPAKKKFLNGDLLYNREDMFLMESHKNSQKEVVSEDQEQDKDKECHPFIIERQSLLTKKLGF